MGSCLVACDRQGGCSRQGVGSRGGLPSPPVPGSDPTVCGRGAAPHAVDLTGTGFTAGVDDRAPEAEVERRPIVHRSVVVGLGEHRRDHPSPAGCSDPPWFFTCRCQVREPLRPGRGYGRRFLDVGPQGGLACRVVLAEPKVRGRRRAACTPAHRRPRGRDWLGGWGHGLSIPVGMGRPLPFDSSVGCRRHEHRGFCGGDHRVAGLAEPPTGALLARSAAL